MLNRDDRKNHSFGLHERVVVDNGGHQASKDKPHLPITRNVILSPTRERLMLCTAQS